MCELEDRTRLTAARMTNEMGIRSCIWRFGARGDVALENGNDCICDVVRRVMVGEVEGLFMNGRGRRHDDRVDDNLCAKDERKGEGEENFN